MKRSHPRRGRGASILEDPHEEINRGPKYCFQQIQVISLGGVDCLTKKGSDKPDAKVIYFIWLSIPSRGTARRLQHRPSQVTPTG